LRKLDLALSELLVPNLCASDVFCCFSGQVMSHSGLSRANLIVSLMFRKFISSKVEVLVL
jgi:hypothetical protein